MTNQQLSARAVEYQLPCIVIGGPWSVRAAVKLALEACHHTRSVAFHAEHMGSTRPAQKLPPGAVKGHGTVQGHARLNPSLLLPCNITLPTIALAWNSKAAS